MESLISRALRGLPPLIVDAEQRGIDTDAVICRLIWSIAKSVEDPERGDFAKGREQMAMYAIALLVGTDWKSIERILFGDEDGR